MGSKYTKDEFISALRQAGIQQGMLVMAHVGMSSLRALPEGVRDQDQLSRFCYECLLEAVGNKGTLCVPSFTYSLGNGICYDPTSTSTENIGEFPEFFWRQPGVSRSNDPIMAVAAKGPLAEDLLTERACTSYGEDSFFDRFIQAGGVLATIGVGIRWATIRYHITEMANVPFRYLKFFYGKRKIGGQIENCEWEYTVRPRAARAGEISQRLGFIIEDELNERSDLMKRISIGRGYISCIPGDIFKKYIMERISANPWMSGDGITSQEDIIREERDRTGEDNYDIDLMDDVDYNFAILSNIPKYPLSDGYYAAMDALRKKYGIRIEEWYTGEKVRGWIVPERWRCRNVEISDAQDNIVIMSSEKGVISAVAYSGSFEGQMTIDKLEKHLYYPESSEVNTQKKRMQTSYFHREWGICMSAESRKILNKENYVVKIDADFSFDRMEVGVWDLNGTKEDEILVVTHMDGERLINFGLSGVMGGLEVFRALSKQTTLHHTWRLLITPGPIGLAAWLERYGDKNVKGIIYLDLLLSQNGTLTYMDSNVESKFDRCIKAVIKKKLPECRIVPYTDNPFNEERMKESEVTDLPGVRFYKMRENIMFKDFARKIRIEESIDELDIDTFSVDIKAITNILEEVDKEDF